MTATSRELPTHTGDHAARGPARNRDDVLSILREAESELRVLGATAVFIYGSAARNELTSESDVDVFIDYDPDGPFSFVEFLEIRDLLLERLQRDLDLSTRRGLNPRLKNRIERTSIQVI